MLRLWFAIRGSGWFAPGRTGGGFPVPARWQGWLMLIAFVLLLLSTITLQGGAAWLSRIVLAVGYVGLGTASYSRED
jgi:hypothetical protein